MQSLQAVLCERPYPGRGCIALRTMSGQLCLAYFLTGRSSASQDRRLVLGPADRVEVHPTTGTGTDPLRHYAAVCRSGRWTVVGNGSHVEEIAASLQAGMSVIDAWAPHSFEPDAPIYTPRIWLVHNSDTGEVRHGFSLRPGRLNANADQVVWTLGSLAPGSGSMMSTYMGDSSRIVLASNPIDVSAASASVESFATELWEALDRQLRVAVAVTSVEPFGRPVLCPP
ncbi:MAG: IMP cyclohydrolase [Acidimicrobiales bacterium]